MRRYRRELDDQWNTASDEIRTVYDERRPDDIYRAITSGKMTSHRTVDPVIDAMEHAICHVTPRCRYLVDGSNQQFDKFAVCITTGFA
jgi:hypothetical protein